MSRKRHESITDYKLRVCETKDALGLTWEEVAKVINEETGDNFGESTYRKWFKSFSEGIDYAIENNADKTVIEKKQIQEFQLKKERAKLTSTRNEINKWVREGARQELIAEHISDAILELPHLEIPNFEARNKTFVNKQKEQVLTVDLADMHFGREGTIRGFKGEVLAEYSEEIFYQRMQELLDEVIEIGARHSVSQVKVFNLGDSIDGLLRLTQLQFLSMGVIESVTKIAEYLSNWLNELSKHFDVEYYSVLGNHAEMRIGGIKSGELPQENLEKIIPWFIKERLKDNKAVRVHDAEFIQIVDVLGTNVCLTHGQNEKNLENSIKDYSMIYGEQIHMLKTGHLHHLNNRTIGMIGDRNIEYVQSPSICGIDEYSMKLKKTAHAGTLVTIFGNKGKVCTYEVRLT